MNELELMLEERWDMEDRVSDTLFGIIIIVFYLKIY
jgi:hypothetical protein